MMKILNLIKIILLSSILLPILIASAGFLDDVKKAKEVQKFKKACEQNNDANACFKAGEIILTNPNPALKEAEALYKKGCELGNLESCKQMTKRGDVNAATKGCELGDFQSCKYLVDKGDLKFALKAGDLTNEKDQKKWYYGQACLFGEVKGCEFLCTNNLNDGKVDGCMELANLAGKNTPPNKDEQIKWWLKACDYGNMDGCTSAGLNIKNPNESSKLLVKACDKLNYKACSILGFRARESGDFKMATNYYTLSCGKKFEDSCEILKEIQKEIEAIKNKNAEMAEKARRADLQAKLAPLKAACESGDLEECTEYGKTMEAPAEQKIPWYKKACDGGYLIGCYLEADAFYDLKNFNKAIELYIKVCNEQEEGYGCYEGGWCAEELNRPADAKKYYLMGCNKNNGDACGFMGNMESKKGNIAEATKFYIKGCGLESSDSCNNLASLQIDWNNITEARKYLNEACDAGSNAACQKLVDLTDEGM